MPPFIKGLDLCEAYYHEVIAPLLEQYFRGVTYSAALIGPGSEVLGFDTEQSRDHDWGPRLPLFLAPDDHVRYAEDITDLLSHELPPLFMGYPTGFAPNEDGTGHLEIVENQSIQHRVGVFTVAGYFAEQLGYDPTGAFTPTDWLRAPAQAYRSLTAGRVFYDGLGTLASLRTRLTWYPDDVWFYILAAQWSRIGQEEAFVGRTAQVGDELGSQLVAGRLVKDVMHLCFLMERVYAPYIKWFGTGFSQLACADTLLPVLDAVLQADTFATRQNALSQAYSIVALMHNDLGITEALPVKVTPFYNRPFDVIHGEIFAEALYARITDPAVLALPRFLGGVDQWTDSTDAGHYLDKIAKVYKD